MKLKLVIIGCLVLSIFLVAMVGNNDYLLGVEQSKDLATPKSAESYQVDYIKTLGTHEWLDGDFEFADAVAVNSTGHVFVYDRIQYWIQIFNPAGIFIKNIYAGPSVNYLLFNASDYLYISNGTRISILDPDLNFYNEFQNATNPNDFTPRGLFINSSGYLYATDPNNDNNDTIHIFTQDGTFIRNFGGDWDPANNFYEPRAVAVNSTGHMYVADYWHSVIQVFDPDGTNSWNISQSDVRDLKLNSTGYLYVMSNDIRVYNPDGLYIYSFQSPNSNGFHEFFTIDSSDNIYTSDGDSGHSDIKKYDYWMNYIATFGQAPYTNPGQFNGLWDVAVNGTGYYFMSDKENSRIQIFTPGGQYFSSFGSGHLSGPCGLDINATGYVYVADDYDSKIVIFDQMGNFIHEFGAYGSGDGYFKYAYDVALNDTGYVYVADYNNDRIQYFTPTGGFLGKWNVAGTSNELYSIDTNSTGEVFVLDRDTANDAVSIYSPNGTLLRSFGDNPGVGNNYFQYPQGIGLDSIGRIYVADTFNNRIKLHDTMGNYLFDFGTSGTAEGEFNGPSEVFVNSTGYIHVTEFLTNRMQIFKMKILTGPTAPTLNSILPSTSTNGSINLTWSEPLLTDNYSVYRNNVEITNGNLWAADEIAIEIDTLSYIDLWLVEGNWWYAIVAHNASGDSPVSNSYMVSINLPSPLPPILNPILPSTSTNGSINLTWSVSLLADNYTVYRYPVEITDVNVGSATKIASEIIALTYVDTWQVEGEWWYVVVAHNETGDSMVSISRKVTINLPTPAAPTLTLTSPATSSTGLIDLSWNAPDLADNYTLYRHYEEITVINWGSATEIATEISATTHQDNWPKEGEWWYAVVAINETGISPLSNSLMVRVDLPNATAPILAVITPNPSTTGSIELHWNADPLVVNYTVLRANVEITASNIDQAQTIKLNLTSNTYTDILSQEGIYWYGIIAFNNTGSSIISNSEMINYSIPSTVNPLNHTNGIWQDVKEGLHIINLTDETGILRLEFIVSLTTATRIKLTYSTSNISQNQLQNAREYWYIEVENPTYINQNESNIKFYYSKTNLSTESLGNLQILGYKNNAWVEVEISWNHDLGYGLVSYSEIQYFTLRVDSSSTQSPYLIDSYVLEWFVVFTAMAVINRIVKTKKLKN